MVGVSSCGGHPGTRAELDAATELFNTAGAPLIALSLPRAAAASIGIRALADTLRGHTLLFTVFAGLMGSLGFASIVCFSVPASRILATFRPRERHPP
ncbi:MAG: hypothetical protein F6K00_35265 [Leptolyngbya sp. SIOISBB]|nr:hypothetical protein [Leptolyngbya sp. SIOISBB]